ncbi:MAG: hypothetical protein NZO41_04865, partial [Candidatus Bipolaricaulota bacterium]|nr:hypothetical protein [Candidatus Bipolaricaulota bacterium]
EVLPLSEAEKAVELHLRLETEQIDKPLLQRLKESLASSPGMSGVYVHLCGEEPVTLKLKQSVGITTALLRRLEAVLGDPARIQRLVRRSLLEAGRGR